jgi:hypothetical protein
LIDSGNNVYGVILKNISNVEGNSQNTKTSMEATEEEQALLMALENSAKGRGGTTNEGEMAKKQPTLKLLEAFSTAVIIGAKKRKYLKE